VKTKMNDTQLEEFKKETDLKFRQLKTEFLGEVQNLHSQNANLTKQLIEKEEEIRKLKFESASGAGGNGNVKLDRQTLNEILPAKLDQVSLEDVVKEVAASRGMSAEAFAAHERTHTGRRGD
jgi:hypothetical protein